MEPTPFPTVITNASIDKVIFQVEHLAGQINFLTSNIEGAANVVGARGKESVERLKSEINNNTIENVKYMLNVINDKTSDWPLQALLIVAITGVILIVITVLFLCMKGGQRLAEMRMQKKLIPNDHDIENH